MHPPTLKKSRPGIIPSGLSNRQLTRFRCWNDNIDLKEGFSRGKVLSRYGPVAMSVVWSSEAAAAVYGCGFKQSFGRSNASIVCRVNKLHRATPSQSSLPGTVRYQRSMIHFAPPTICQTAAVATTNTMTAASKAIESRIPSSSR